MDEIRFDGWVLRRDSGELSRGGRSVRLPPQPCAILETLLARPGEVVTREELVARLWPTGIVEFDVALNTAVRRLRAALEDDAEHPRYIETVPRRGYRFVGTMASPADGDMAPAAAPVDDPVVTPARSPARTQLLPRIATAVSIAIVAVVLVTLSDAKDTPGTPPAHTTHRGAAFAALEATAPRAAERYRRALFMLDRRNPDDLARAGKHLRDVIAQAPEFAPAHVALAKVHFLQAVAGDTELDAGLERSRAAAERALQLDPGLAEAHLRLATFHSLRGMPERRDAHLAQAFAMEPSNAMVLVYRADLARHAGRLEDAVRLMERAVAGDPLNLTMRYNLGAALFVAGRYDDASRVMDELLEIDPLYRADLRAELAIVDQRHEDALRIASAWQDDAAKWQYLAIALHGLARRQEADAALRRLIDDYGTQDPLRVVEVLAFRGEYEAAFEWLSRPPQALGPAFIARRRAWQLDHSPHLNAMRGDPRWRQWIAGQG